MTTNAESTEQLAQLRSEREARAREVLAHFECLAQVTKDIPLCEDCVDALLYLDSARERADRLRYSKLALEMTVHRLRGENARARDIGIAMELAE